MRREKKVNDVTAKDKQKADLFYLSDIFTLNQIQEEKSLPTIGNQKSKNIILITSKEVAGEVKSKHKSKKALRF